MTYEFNNIYCEDSYNAIKNIPDKCIDLIITDPPYLIENTIAGGKRLLGKREKVNTKYER
jgi:site-specific DNA-methyltransferase (adenine-specific)